MDHVLENLKEVVATKPTDIIIQQVKDLLMSGQLKPGDKLPPERKLSEKFGVGRTHVREAIRKLEFYGILKTRPQSGTYVASIGISALESLIADVLKIDGYSFLSLVETREVLELSSVFHACERHNEEDIRLLENSLNDYIVKAEKHVTAVEEDLMFHLTIADLGKNKVLKSMLLIIIPDIIASYNVFNVCQSSTNKALEEHRILYDQIKKRDAEAAVQTMKEHLKGVMTFARSIIQ
ncbi:FadR family transcriptional regulator [Segetibacter sp. 3557_3]|uniref:FadR/GntR family transcriptional regulator n=1 Tax=Segetibacter sp. 3557_3 TaxID=2547429 RepID=UPI0010591F9E|nr:FadR/GntR family transcriptional regulator [Segetibacter sp. 3557_3]TDH28629.1 FadR family transcriptional regulator [Segetibacter sp. 3557_3]